MVRSESNISLDYKDPHSHYDLPPPYSPPSTSTPAPEKSIPDEFLEYKEDDLAALRDYDTVIIVDDSKSMKAVWNEVNDPFSPLLTNMIPDSRPPVL